MHIDLNADIGEGFADEAIVPWLSSANISCGAHAGSEADIRKAMRLCKQFNVAIGAHPSYPDRAHFGRQVLALPFTALRASLIQQLDFFFRLAADEGVAVTHLKAHGALYNEAAQNHEIGQLLIDLCVQYQITLMTLAQSPLLLQANKQQVPTVAEAFADRSYQANGQLVARSLPGALLAAPQAIAQSLQLIMQQQITTLDGELLNLQAESLCLHGDSPQAILLARELHQALLQHHIAIKAKAIDHSFFPVNRAEA